MRQDLLSLLRADLAPCICQENPAGDNMEAYKATMDQIRLDYKNDSFNVQKMSCV